VNLLIAILSNTYAIFEVKSNSVYYMEVLESLPIMEPHCQYGNLISSVVVINIVPFFFLPLTLLINEESIHGKRLNNFILILEFLPTLLVGLVVYTVCNALLIVPCWFKMIYVKIHAIFSKQREDSIFGRILAALLFILGGWLICMFYFLVDILRYLKIVWLIEHKEDSVSKALYRQKSSINAYSRDSKKSKKEDNIN
jgi:hypothetical protein